MANDPFDFSDVFADLEKKIDDFMHFDTTHEAASRMFADSTEELVYKKYTPTGYPRYDMYGEGVSRRKGDDGLQDWRNYHVLNIGRMSMTVINETKGNPVWNPQWNPLAYDPFDPGYISDIIESGHGYNWKYSVIYRTQQARPFMEEACNRFVDTYLLPTIHSLYFDD